MKGIIPAAGLGTRFLPITKAQPKEMVPAYDKPVIQYVVQEAVDSGIDDILIITGRRKRAIEDHFDKSYELEDMLEKSGKTGMMKELDDLLERVDIHYVRQREQKGLGDAIYCARKHVGREDFAVLLGDVITQDGVPCTKQLMDANEEKDASVIAVKQIAREKIASHGIVDIEPGQGLYRVLDLVEKPSPEEAPSNLGIIGRYVLTPEIFDCIKKVKPGALGEIQLTDALKLLGNRTSIYAHEFKGKTYDMGNTIGWLKNTIELAMQDKNISEDLRDFLKRFCK